jgi:hypothetical protein
MNDGKHCPSCSKDIGTWPIFKAGLPNLIRCPHCNARLTYSGTWPLIVLLVALSVLLAGAIYYAVGVLSLQWPANVIVFGAALLLLWIPVEILVASYLRNNKVLRRLDV